MKLYIANKNYSSWSLRPWILMKEKGIAFEEKLMPFTAPPGANGFESFSPNGRVPCLDDSGRIVWDSLAIVEYLAETHPGIWPADRDARAWARSASAEMHSGFQRIRDTCTMNCGIRVQLREQPPAFLAEWRRVDALWNEGLSRFGGPFLAGRDFTAVDAFFAPFAFRVQTYSPPVSDEARAYVGRLLERPGMREWYAAALTETWREVAHEEEVRVAGEVLQDFRARA